MGVAKYQYDLPRGGNLRETSDFIPITQSVTSKTTSPSFSKPQTNQKAGPAAVSPYQNIETFGGGIQKTGGFPTHTNSLINIQNQKPSNSSEHMKLSTRYVDSHESTGKI